jgi:hypothetical protein
MEHPEITNARRTGYPHREPKYPHCPICCKECETIYWSKFGEVVGCDECLEKQDAWDNQKEFCD